MPKIHKPEVPLQPTVSSIGSSTYQLSKHLANDIGHLAGNSPQHFVRLIRDEKMQPDEVIVCFDVESLYTSAPVKEALEIIRRRVRE